MNSSKLAYLALACAVAFVPSAALASSSSKAKAPASLDDASPVNPKTRLVVFNYDPNLSYQIVGLDGVYTHIDLRPGEVVQGLYLSDTTRWRHHVAANKERIFLKPTAPGLFNTATLVTNKRVYELTFTSVSADAPWYQRVRWSIPDESAVPLDQATGVFEEKDPAAGAKNADRALIDALAAMNGAGAGASPAAGRVAPDKLNFSYKIEGDAAFKPRVVFDDGKFTWIQVSGHQDMPAVFSINKSGTHEVINYTVNGDYIVITRVLDGLLLKLGSDEVRVLRNANCGLFGC